jgi:hypothetical protein
MRFKNKRILLAVVLGLCGVADADVTWSFFSEPWRMLMYSDAVVEAVVENQGTGPVIHFVILLSGTLSWTCSRAMSLKMRF